MKILIATDGSDYSQAAFEKCCEIAPENSTIKVVSVYQPVVPVDAFPQSFQYAEELEQASRSQAEAFVEHGENFIRQCFADRSVEVTAQVLQGAFDQEIINAAKDWNADLIIVGSHGRGFWGRLTLGSVSDSIIHHAPCSVLVVKKASGENA